MRGNTLIKKDKELNKMARIRKEYKMTEKNVAYIEEVKEKNNLIFRGIILFMEQ